MSSSAVDSTPAVSYSIAIPQPHPTPSAALSPPVALDTANVGNQATLTVHATTTVNTQHIPSASFPDTVEKPSSSSSSYLQSQLSSGFDTTFFEFNDASSLTQYFITTAIAKTHSAIWPRFISGLLSGLFVVIGAVFALVAAGGLSESLRAASPAIPKLLSGITFPIALVLIMFVGGDLFTGNCMYMGLGLLTGRVPLRQVINVLLVSFFSNLCGCLLFSWFLGFKTELFTAEPYNSWVLSVANGKVALDWGVVVLKGIGANTLVCIGIFMGSSSRTALGRLVIAWIPVLVFSVIGYEHVVANMAFIPIALMYGGTSFSTAQYIGRSMVPAAVGNFIGGGILLGGFLTYMYAWKGERHSTLSRWLQYHLVPQKSVVAILKEIRHQVMNDSPIEG